MKNYIKNLFLKVMSLVLVLFLTLPSQIFASAITSRDDKAYDGNKSIMGLAGLSTTSSDDLAEKSIENTQVLSSDRSIEETNDFFIEKSASISKTTGYITYKIAVINKEKESGNKQSVVFAINSNLSDMKVDKVTALSDDGNEREISYKENNPSILNSDKDIETFAISTANDDTTTIYYIYAKLSDEKSLEQIESSTDLFAIDYAILDGENTLYQERYCLKIDEQNDNGHFALIENEDSTNIINATYNPASSNIFGHSPATISYTDFILPKDDQEFIYKLQLDDNQATENSQINIDFYQAKEEGYVTNKTYSHNIPFTKELKLQIPSGQLAKISFTSTVKENVNPQNFTFNNKAIANPDYKIVSSKEGASDEDPLPDDSFDKDAGVNSSNDSITHDNDQDFSANPNTKKAKTSTDDSFDKDAGTKFSNDSIAHDNDQDFSANPNTKKAKTSTDNSFNNESGSNSSNDSIAHNKDQDFSTNSNTEKEESVPTTTLKSKSGSNSYNDIIADEKDLDFSSNSKNEDKISPIAINKDGYLTKLNNESRLTDQLEKAINDIESALEAYNNDEIYLDELQASMAKIASQYNLESNQVEEVINALISGLNAENHKVAKLNVSDIEKYIASNDDGQRNVEKALAGPDAKIPSDYLDRLVSEKLEEEGITIEDFQKYMYELEEKYNITDEDVDRIYTENEEAIKNLISKAREEKTTGDVFAVNKQSAFRKTYPYDVDYWTYQYYDQQNNTVNWDIQIETDQINRDYLDFNKLGLALYAPEAQGLENYKVSIMDYPGNIKKTDRSLIKEQNNPTTGKTLATGKLTKTSDGLLTFDKTFDKGGLNQTNLPNNLYIHVEATPKADHAKYQMYDLGLRLTPDKNYIQTIYEEFQNDWAKLVAAMPWIIPFKSGDGKVVKFKDGFNIVDTRLPADAMVAAYQDDKYQAKSYTDKSRSVFGEFTSPTSNSINWQISDTLRLQDDDRFVSDGKLGKDIFATVFNSNNNTSGNVSVEVLEPKIDGSFKQIHKGNYSSDSDFRNALSGIKQTLIPGTVINYNFAKTAKNPTSDSTATTNFSERLDLGFGTYGGKQTATLRRLSTEEKNKIYHIGRQLDYKTNYDGKWTYTATNVYRVNENYDMVFCINPEAPQPARPDFWNDKNKMYITKHPIKNAENDLRPYLQQNKNGIIAAKKTPEKILEDLKKVYYYGEIIRNSQEFKNYNSTNPYINSEEEKFYEMMSYAIAGVSADPRHTQELDNLDGTDTTYGKKLLSIINDTNTPWTDEMSNSVELDMYPNTKSKNSAGVGNSRGVYQNMITGRVNLPIKINKIDENGNPLSGAEFELRTESGSTIEQWTSESSPKELFLKPGTYKLVETKTPDGSYRKLEPITIEVSEKYEVRQQNDIPIQKDDSTMAGIPTNLKSNLRHEKISLKYYGGDQDVLVIDPNEKSKGRNISGANYKQLYRETVVKSGETDNKLVSFNEDTLNLNAKNVKGAKLEVSKKLLAADGEYHNLPGVKFTLKEDKLLGGTSKEVTTNKNGIAVFDNLPLNSNWILTETIPNGIFNHNATWKVSVDATGKVTITENGDISGLGKGSTIDNDKGTITIYNKTEQNSSFKIKKVDDKGKPLGSVGFTLYQQDKKTPIRSKDSSNTEYFTNEDGYLYFSNLPDGIYYLKETTVPDGYAVLNDGWTGLKIESGNVTIIKPEDETASENTTQKDYSKVEISNTKPNGADAWIEYDIVNHLDNVDVSFTKYGITKDSNGEEYTQILPGAEFKLQILKDNEFVDTGKTARSDNSGQVVFKGLSSGEYQIIETKTASDAYRLPDGAVKTFKVEAGKVYIKTANGYEEYEDNKNDYIYNEQKGLGKLLVHKVDDKGANLAGVEFTLYKFDPTNPENALDIVNTATTNEDGYAVWEDLPYGKYWIKETKARPGYILDTEKKLVNITKDYTVPDHTNPRDISNSISIDRYSSYVYSTEGNLYEVYPNYGQGLVANLTLNINPQTKVIPGDQFTLRLSDNLDLDGVGNVSDGSDGKYDIIGRDGTIAKASIGSDRKTITYTFTNAIRNKSVSSMRLVAPMYPNRLKVVNDTTPRFNVSIGKSSFAKNNMTVYYSHYQKDNTKPFLNAYTYKLDPINNKFTVIAYVNSNRVYSANKQYLFEANTPVSIDSFETYRSSNNNLLPASYGIDFNNPGQYGLTYLGNRYNYNNANQYWVELEANNNYTYAIKIEGTLKSPTPTAFETQSYLKHTYENCCWDTYTANTWSRFYDPSACGDTSTDNPKPSEQMLEFVNKENAIEFTKVDGSEDPLEGAKFKLVKDGVDYGEIQTSDANGKFGWKKLEKGKYEVIETDAPRGYTKPKDPVSSFEVNENGEIVNIKDNTTTIKNYKASLPITGGSGTFIGFALFGTAVMLTALAYFGFFQMKSIPFKRRSLYR